MLHSLVCSLSISPDNFHCCCRSVIQSCPAFCDPMDCSTPGLSIPHCLPEFAQVRVHWIGDANQPSHPLSPSSPSAFNLTRHQSLPISRQFNGFTQMQFPRLTWISTLHRNPRRPRRLFQHATWEMPHRLDGRGIFPLGWRERYKHLVIDRRPSSISGKGNHRKTEGTGANLYYQELCESHKTLRKYINLENNRNLKKKKALGTSLVIQWLRLQALNAGARFQPWSGD